MRLKQIEGPVWIDLHYDIFTAASCRILCYTGHKVSLQWLSARKRWYLNKCAFQLLRWSKISPFWNRNKLCCRLHKNLLLGLSFAKYVQYASSVHIRFTLILSWHVRLGIPRGILFTLSGIKLDVWVCQLMQHVQLIAMISITYLLKAIDHEITTDINAFWETLFLRNIIFEKYYPNLTPVLRRGTGGHVTAESLRSAHSCGATATSGIWHAWLINL